jgi:tetratricopeptide (TPR) repeat protein
MKMKFKTFNLTLALGVSMLASMAYCAQTPAEAAKPAAVDSSESAASLSNPERLYRSGKFDAAEKEYKALISSAPSPGAYAGLARVYLRKKNPAEAHTAATKAIELGPASDAAHVAIGEVYFREGNIGEAEKEFIALIKSGTREPRAYLGMARVSWASSYYKQAKRMIDRARTLDPDDPDIQRYWLRTLSLQDRIRALQEYLSRETDDDAKDRTDFQHGLVVDQDEAALPTRPCRQVTTINATQTNLKYLLRDANHLRGFGLGVSLNGVASTLMLDTGSNGISVDRKIAEKAGIKQIAPFAVRGIGDQGDVAGYIGYADSIKIGELEFRDCYLEVIEKNSVAGEDGLIGGDVFGRYLVDLDFPNRKLKLSQLPPRPEEPETASGLDSRPRGEPEFHDRYIAPEMKSFSPVFRFGHELLVPTRLNESAPKLFLLDTGSLTNFISPDAAREVTKISRDPRTHVSGINGSVKDVFRADELTLAFGGVKQRNTDIITIDMTGISNSTGAEVSGILGFVMLNLLEVKIDYRDGLVDFHYDQK